MNTKKVLAALALSATMAFGATGLAACTPEENKGGESGDRDLQIYAIYELYAETAGDDAMTYDQWYANLLETAKGAKGDNGKSAYDIWKENGHTGTEQDFLDSLKGTNGIQGVGVKNITINAEGKLVITLTNDEVITLGKVVGENGAAGKGVKNFEINGEGKLVVTYSDDSTETLDKVVGNDGRSITGAHIDEEGKLVLEFGEGDNITAGDVKGVGIKSIEIVEGKFKITMTDDEVIELDIPTSVHTHNWTQGKEVAATCTSIGYTQYTCDVDDCTELKYEFTDATGHTFNQDPDFEIPAATCKDKGLKVFICSECGATKGEATTGEHKYGDDGNCEYCKEPRPEEKPIKDFGQMTLSANVSKPLDVAGVEDGTYYLVFETASEAKSKTLIAEIGYSEEYADYPQNYDMYMPISAKYQCVFIKNGDISTLSLKSSEEITGTAKLMQYTIPTITAGVEIEVPCVHKDYAFLPINIDSSFIGHKVKIEVKSMFVNKMDVRKNDEKHTVYASMVQDTSDQTLFTLTTTISEGETAICLSSSKLEKDCTVTIKITLVD